MLLCFKWVATAFQLRETLVLAFVLVVVRLVSKLRDRVHRENVKRLGEVEYQPKEDDVKAKEDIGLDDDDIDVDVEKENANSRQELDAETFDDGELYHILLKELLESGAGSGGHLQAGMQARSASKKKKQVDRKASKVCEYGLQ